MTPLTRPRFGIRALLVLVAIVAISAYIFRGYRNLHNAREELQRIMANYEAMRVTAQDVVNASKKLMTAESGTLWISKRAAIGAHVERLKNLLNKLQSPVSESEPQEIQRRVEFIQQELHDISD
jgi:hypothetical protein